MVAGPERNPRFQASFPADAIRWRGRGGTSWSPRHGGLDEGLFRAGELMRNVERILKEAFPNNESIALD